MTDVAAILLLLQSVAVAVLWGEWMKERDQRRDYATDLAQAIHDYDLGRRDLRRSLDHKEVQRAVERHGEEEVNDD